jgi:hypothetical protein
MGRKCCARGNEFRVAFSTHPAGPLIADNRVRSGTPEKFSAWSSAGLRFPAKNSGAPFLTQFIQGEAHEIQHIVTDGSRATGKEARSCGLLVPGVHGDRLYPRHAP